MSYVIEGRYIDVEAKELKGGLADIPSKYGPAFLITLRVEVLNLQSGTLEVAGRIIEEADCPEPLELMAGDIKIELVVRPGAVDKGGFGTAMFRQHLQAVGFQTDRPLSFSLDGLKSAFIGKKVRLLGSAANGRMYTPFECPV